MSVTVSRVDDDVLRLHCRTWRGRMVGYDVSAWVMRGMLVDSGFPQARREFLRAVDGLAVRGVILTHHHEDHAGSAPELAARGMPLRMHLHCEAVLRERPVVAPYRHLIWGRPARLVAPVIAFDPAPLELVPLPGHSDDHLGVWDAERRVLASGDLFLGVKVRVAQRDERPALLVESLRRAAALDPVLMLDAHRGPIRHPVPLLRAKADWLEETMAAVRALAADGVPAREITRRVLGREPLVGLASVGQYSKRAMVEGMVRE